jgi:DhnA family fructose-bisphosphate aldolase class Ia
MIATSMGKQLRLRRVFRRGKILVLPFDHPIYFGPQRGAEDPARLVALAREHGATAVLLTAGSLRRGLPEIGDLGVIMRVDTTISQLGGRDTLMHLLHSAEEALALGADMVVVNCYIGIGDESTESDLLKKLAAVSRECEVVGMPLCGEIIPRAARADDRQTSPTSSHLALAMRLGLEYGPKSDDDLSIFTQLKEAMAHGASGAAIGRRVWGSDRPAAVLEAIRAIVMDDAEIDQAIQIYRKS